MSKSIQHNEEVRKRLKTVFNASGKSSRAFSESIGLKPTSFHKVLTGAAGLTIPLANSIELNHGYRAEWLLTGKGLMKVGKHKQLSPVERCILEVSLSSTQKWHILELLIIEKIKKEIANQFWDTLRDGTDLQVGDKHRTSAHVNLDKITNVFSELREEEKTCLENHDPQGQKLYALLTQALLLATYYGKEWDSLKNNCEEYQSLETGDILGDFDKLLSYINGLLSDMGPQITALE